MTPPIKRLSINWNRPEPEKEKSSTDVLCSSIFLYTHVVGGSQHQMPKDGCHPNKRQVVHSARLLKSPSGSARSLEKLSFCEAEDFNKKLFVELKHFIENDKAGMPSAELCDKTALAFCRREIDEKAQRQSFLSRSVGDVLLEYSPRAREAVQVLQTEGKLAQPYISKLQALRIYLGNCLKEKNKSTFWASQLDEKLEKLVGLEENLVAFVDELDNHVVDLQIEELILSCFANKGESAEPVIMVLRKWASANAAAFLRHLVKTYVEKNIQRENIPFQIHELQWPAEEDPFKRIGAKAILDTFTTGHHRVFSVNQNDVSCTDLEAIFTVLHEPAWELFKVCEKIDWAKVDALLSRNPVRWDEVQRAAGIYDSSWELIHPLLAAGKKEGEIGRELIGSFALLQLCTKESFEACKTFMQGIFPKFFQSPYSLAEIENEKLSTCKVIVGEKKDFSVVRQRFVQIEKGGKILGAVGVKWSVSSDGGPEWKGRLGITDIYIDEKVCDLDLKWEVLDAFINFSVPEPLLQDVAMAAKTKGLRRCSSPRPSSGVLRPRK